MQKKTKYSLSFLALATILGAPAFLLSQTDSMQASQTEALKNQPLSSNIADSANIEQAINSAPAPAAGTPSASYSNEDSDIDHAYLNPIDRIKAIQNKNELHQALLADNEQFLRYPEYNRAFSEPADDPVVQRYEIEERTTQNKEDQTQLNIWSDKKYYLPGDQATVFASLRDRSGAPLSTVFMGQLIYNEEVSLQTIEFSDHNQDGIYEHSIALNSDSESVFKAGVYKVLIVNKTNKMSDAVTFILSKPEIALTGNYKDSVSAKGELLIQAEVEVTAKNRFYFQASLYSANKIPIGSTQQAIEVSAGKHWVTLVFDGRLITDSGESGPFLLQNLSVAKVTLPMQRAPMQQPEYFTQDYALSQFNSKQQAESDRLQANFSNP